MVRIAGNKAKKVGKAVKNFSKGFLGLGATGGQTLNVPVAGSAGGSKKGAKKFAKGLKNFSSGFLGLGAQGGRKRTAWDSEMSKALKKRSAQLKSSNKSTRQDAFKSAVAEAKRNYK